MWRVLKKAENGAAFAGPPSPKWLRRLKAGSRLCDEALRRASAQAGRHLAVLTYFSVRSARPNGGGLSFEKPQDSTGRTFLNTPLGQFIY